MMRAWVLHLGILKNLMVATTFWGVWVYQPNRLEGWWENKHRLAFFVKVIC
jgi:hypothetical protein